MSKAKELIYSLYFDDSRLHESVKSYVDSDFTIEEGESAAFKKFWSLVIDNAIRISKKTLELTKGVSIITTGYRITGINLPKNLRGKGLTDSKTGKMIVVSDDGESAALVEF